MSNPLQSIVDRLVGQLPDNLSHFTLNELLNAGWPDFVVARVKVELERNLADSVTLPENDWADMHAHAVQEAWVQFLEAIRAETRLPISYARPVLETSIEDILDQLSQPLTALPDYLYGTLPSLTRDHLASRVSKTGVYPQLIHSLVRYMDRKKIDVLSKDEAARILRAVDSKLTEHHTALNWGQVLSPMFELMPDGVDPDLLAAYFAERGMKVEAREFLDFDRPVDKSKLIELLSQPFEDLEDDVIQEIAVLAPEPDVVAEEVAAEPVIDEEPEIAPEPEPEPEPEIVTPIEIDPEPIVIPIWQRFMPGEEEAEKEEPVEKETPSILNFYNKDPSEDPRASLILELMSDMEHEFIVSLFGDEESAYASAIADIARYDTYAEAVRYIRKEIFDRNRIDMYSDDAALFLDRVQTYFLENT